MSLSGIVLLHTTLLEILDLFALILQFCLFLSFFLLLAFEVHPLIKFSHISLDVRFSFLEIILQHAAHPVQFIRLIGVGLFFHLLLLLL